MLKGINPLLNSDVLFALRAMGHGDDLILADMNFPAESIALQTTYGHLIRIDNTTAAEVAKAVLSIFPIDTFTDDSLARMELVDNPDEIPPVQSEVQHEIDQVFGTDCMERQMTPVERYAFYERAKKAFCVIQTGERRFYGCFAFRKGVIPPDS